MIAKIRYLEREMIVRKTIEISIRIWRWLVNSPMRRPVKRMPLTVR